MFLSIGVEELDCRGLGRSWSLLTEQGARRCTSLYDRAHYFAGEVAGCPVSIPRDLCSQQGRGDNLISVSTLRTLTWLGL